jgi:trehalose 6-phosphate phosphatase
MRDDGLTRLPAPPLLHRDHALFLDFDGTLVEIAPAPDLVRVAPELPDLLHALSVMLEGAVALVSGRTVDDLARRIAPFAGALAGQHGLERRSLEGTVTRSSADPALAPIRLEFARFAARHDGVTLEDKGAGLALHYRGAPGCASACKTLVQRAAQSGGDAFTFIDGKMVAELSPRRGGKGRAIAAFLAEPPFRGRMPVFVGDDTTDEDGFGVVNDLGGASVHVGESATAARYGLATVGDVLAWLAWSLGR